MKRKSILLGIVGALIGAVVGSIPWMVAYNFNWFLSILGTLIGVCGMKGYEMLKGPDGKVKVFVIVTITLIVVVLAQYVTTIFAIYTEYQDVRFAPTLLDSMDILNDWLFTNPEVTQSFLINIGMGIFFAILGISGLFKDKQEKPVRTLTTDETQLNDTGSNDQEDLNDYNV